jgi:hypothetical protein
MTALTWSEARKRLHCECVVRDARYCAANIDRGLPPCDCQCHRYMREGADTAIAETERAA